MNKWVEKSIKLANSHGYLDNLTRVYPVNLTLTRNISIEEKEKIRNALRGRKTKELISILLDLERFPIDDPYIGFLRKDRQALDKNPKTINRMGKRLLNMGFDGILSGASRAKTPSRQVGQMYKNWLYKMGYPILSRDDFLKYNNIAILRGGDDALKRFAAEALGYKEKKGLDVVLRNRDRFVIGEAKFITTSGGTQDKSFREAMLFIKNKGGKAIRIAILDGVVWLVSQNKSKKSSLYQSILGLKEGEVALSALLLKDFIKNL